MGQADSDAQPGLNQGPRTRKVTVQLSDGLFQRLEAATERPGLGKSMVVETALARFLNPAPAAEGLAHGLLDRISRQMARLEREIAIIAETVALHARYHLTVTPPLQPSEQRQVCLLGQQRFRVLVEKVERRVRLGQPLIQETIDKLARANRPLRQAHGSPSRGVGEEQLGQEGLSAAVVDENAEPTAAAGECGSNLNFRTLPNSFC